MKNILTINLEKKLLKIKEKDASFKAYLKDSEKYLKESEKFLQNQESDYQILKKLGMTESIEKGKKILSKIETDKNKNSLLPIYEEKRVFTTLQIKKLCLDYRLRFLPSKMYCGEIDEKLPEKIREFETTSAAYKQCFKYSSGYSEDQYYICAPASSFELKERNDDPLFFAKLSEDRYYLVYKWGNDLSIFRRILGFVTKNTLNMYSSTYAFIWLILQSVFYKFTHDENREVFYALIVVFSLFSFILTFLYFAAITGLEEKSISSEKCWNSEFE